MDSLPSPPASSVSSGKNKWAIKKYPTTTTTPNKLERFLAFLLASWATISTNAITHNQGEIVTRSLLPNMIRQCLDLLMFTSAMVITLFNYFSGDLDKQPSIKSSSSSTLIPPPSQHTIMDIKQLRQWQQQSHHTYDRLEYITATCPMDDLKQHRIMAWASSQGYQDGDVTQGHQSMPLTSTSLRLHSNTMMEEVDDDEKYTFDERWSVDGDGIKMQQHTSALGKLSISSSTSTVKSTQHEENKRLALMEVQVASLIQQGQAALSKKIKVYELDRNEIALRRALKQRDHAMIG
ncbi:uncharacterized protein BX664DRAFT_355670 [Halteromyces radiatus]|uniref:uncharacterized protein n=1 Tax=Halteromyces radiatus TaxID=101107 RepID=UPI00221EEF7E|nr:uncharacterized protein BX664DRAFT_355670 [Halteromyces radiatus]KAI8096287.1 hypothetical protein BX664DRAFT_355670 [Halteromyces radiatus]